MVSSEVQRTLVKSPPELWAELSDPDALARHLGALGEIRITKVEPEQRVEWEAEHTTGAVAIKPTGWGTKVTISVTRELEPAAAEPEPALAPSDPEASAEPADPDASAEPARLEAPAPEAAQTEPEEPEAAQSDALLPGPAQPELAQPEGELAQPEGERDPATATAPERPRGFLARLFRRRARPIEAASETPPARAVTDEVEADETTCEEAAVAEPVAIAPPAPITVADFLKPGDETASIAPTAPAPSEHLVPITAEPAAEEEGPVEETAPATVAPDELEPTAAEDISEELRAAEEIDEDDVTAILTAVLDRLGAAHHRPFSRS